MLGARRWLYSTSSLYSKRSQHTFLGGDIVGPEDSEAQYCRQAQRDEVELGFLWLELELICKVFTIAYSS